MKRIVSVTVILFVIISSCKKESHPPPPQLLGWRVDGGPEIKGDSISFLPLFNSWFATKDTVRVSISVSSFGVGTYTQSAGTASVSYYGDLNSTYTISSQVYISSSANNLVRGTFNATVAYIGVDTFFVTGRFENLWHL